MRIVTFGATGMVGTRLVSEASGRGHEVVAASRGNAGSGGRNAGYGGASGEAGAGAISTVAVDARDQSRVADLLRTADVAISAVRPRPGEEASVPEATRALLDAAAETQTALLLIGGAGPLISALAPATLVLDDERFVPAQWRSSAVASLVQLRVCEGHGAAWTYLSPPAVLEPGIRTGTYRRGTTTLLLDAAGRSRISAEDLAVAALDEVEHPGEARHFTVAY
ncbi:NAD(P)-dependent oxidoreductase [Promicromonospora sp. Populi]|uniref:NAD(P)-dependent oxidoreductase n=1 Tax=Promicromonospora sp. Populi TaxID=3239420 RepID=UPI0034E1E0F3